MFKRMPFNEILDRVKTGPDDVFAAKRLAQEAEAAAARKRDRDECWRRLLRERGERYRDCKLSNFECSQPGQAEVRGQLTEFCRSISANVNTGRGLLLFGPKGTGKDHLLMACARAAIASFHSLLWVNGMEIFGEFRDAMDAKTPERDVRKKFAAPDVLWISDPTPPTEALTPAQATWLFRILDDRYSHRKATWVTVNVTGQSELEKRLGGQNADRLIDGSLTLGCNWKSYRRSR
jgi:DNA replication protein DnaC